MPLFKGGCRWAMLGPVFLLGWSRAACHCCKGGCHWAMLGLSQAGLHAHPARAPCPTNHRAPPAALRRARRPTSSRSAPPAGWTRCCRQSRPTATSEHHSVCLHAAPRHGVLRQEGRGTHSGPAPGCRPLKDSRMLSGAPGGPAAACGCPSLPYPSPLGPCLASPCHRDAEGADEEEFLENVFDTLCSALMAPGNREAFVGAEGERSARAASLILSRQRHVQLPRGGPAGPQRPAAARAQRLSNSCQLRQPAKPAPGDERGDPAIPVFIFFFLFIRARPPAPCRRGAHGADPQGPARRAFRRAACARLCHDTLPRRGRPGRRRSRPGSCFRSAHGPAAAKGWRQRRRAARRGRCS